MSKSDHKSFDLVVVGGGPGGYVAAIRAAQHGLKVALVEKQHMGGICLNWGCIPTKALLKGAEVAHTLEEAKNYGFTVPDWSFEMDGLVKHSRNVAGRLSGGVGFLMKKNGVEVIDGVAKLADIGILSVDLANSNTSLQIKADHIILATGARPRSIPGVEPDGKLIWTYFEAMVPETQPKALLVIGSGAIGVEFASLYNDLGTDVTIVEIADRIMPGEDAAVSEFAAKTFERRGMKIHASSKVQSLEKGEDSVSVTVEGPNGDLHEYSVDRVILSAGIQGNIEDLGLEGLGVDTDRSFISTDGFGRTNVVGIYAIGDVAGPPCLAHKASHEGIVCVDKIVGLKGVHAVDKVNTPRCTYCRPQVASFGLTEQQARSEGYSVKTGQFNLQSNGKALSIGDGNGFVKTVFDGPSGEILGVHMIGPEVTEQIQGLGIAQQLEATLEELTHSMFAHPTISEAMHEAILDADGRALHQ